MSTTTLTLMCRFGVGDSCSCKSTPPARGGDSVGREGDGTRGSFNPRPPRGGGDSGGTGCTHRGGRRSAHA